MADAGAARRRVADGRAHGHSPADRTRPTQTPKRALDSRLAWHREGVRAARRVAEAAPALGVATLTLFAFSSDNWKRPRAEVEAARALHRAGMPVGGTREAEEPGGCVRLEPLRRGRRARPARRARHAPG